MLGHTQHWCEMCLTLSCARPHLGHLCELVSSFLSPCPVDSYNVIRARTYPVSSCWPCPSFHRLSCHKCECLRRRRNSWGQPLTLRSFYSLVAVCCHYSTDSACLRHYVYAGVDIHNCCETLHGCVLSKWYWSESWGMAACRSHCGQDWSRYRCRTSVESMHCWYVSDRCHGWLDIQPCLLWETWGRSQSHWNVVCCHWQRLGLCHLIFDCLCHYTCHQCHVEQLVRHWCHLLFVFLAQKWLHCLCWRTMRTGQWEVMCRWCACGEREEECLHHWTPPVNSGRSYWHTSHCSNSHPCWDSGWPWWLHARGSYPL